MRNDARRSSARRLALALLIPVGSAVAQPTDQPGDAADAATVDLLRWEALPPLPDPVGRAGPVAGVSNDALIVAGGANFPDGPPWEGHSKVWYDDAFVLTGPDGEWQTGHRLPRPLAYGVSLTGDDGVICLGGGDADRHYADAFILRWTDGEIAVDELPPLPGPFAFGTGALLDNVVYVAGGTASPSSTQALGTFWALDLSAPRDSRRWRVLEPWPGPGRMLAVMGVQDGSIYLFSGARLFVGPDGQTTREFLTDSYRYDRAANQWTRIADTPQPIVAAPNPAIPVGHAHLLTLAGDDGANFFRQQELKDDHPGFPAEIFAYHTITNAWAPTGTFPKTRPADLGPHRNAGQWPPVTTVIVPWRDRFVIPSGEVRPGVRTPVVWSVEPVKAERAFGVINWLVLAGYLVVLIVIGIRFAGRATTTQDYFLGGRRIAWWAVGLSIFGTQLSAITYLALPARSFATDWTHLVLNMGIVVLAPLVVFAYLPLFRKFNLTSAYEYLEHRFDLGVRLFGSVAFVAFQLGRMGVVVLLPALALSAVTGVDVYVCIAVMGVLATAYTALGGIEAVIWTDVIQVVVLLGGAVVALLIIVTNLDGGWSELYATGLAHEKFNLIKLQRGLAGDGFHVIVLGALFSNSLIPYTADQAVIQRYLSTSSERHAARAIWTNALLVIPATLLFFLLGTALYAFYQAQPARLAPLDQVDQTFPWFIAHEMPAGLAGLVVAGVFAAAMSSLDSSMHSITTVVTTDFVRRFKPALAESTYLRFARGLTIVLGLVGTGTAMLMAGVEIKFLWDFFLGIMGLFGGTLAGLFMLGFFVPRVAAVHAWIGTLASLGGLAYAKFLTDWNGLLYGFIGVAVCTVTAILASFVVPASSKRALQPSA